MKKQLRIIALALVPTFVAAWLIIAVRQDERGASTSVSEQPSVATSVVEATTEVVEEDVIDDVVLEKVQAVMLAYASFPNAKGVEASIDELARANILTDDALHAIRLEWQGAIPEGVVFRATELTMIDEHGQDGTTKPVVQAIVRQEVTFPATPPQTYNARILARLALERGIWRVVELRQLAY